MALALQAEKPEKHDNEFSGSSEQEQTRTFSLSRKPFFLTLLFFFFWSSFCGVLLGESCVHMYVHVLCFLLLLNSFPAIIGSFVLSLLLFFSAHIIMLLSHDCFFYKVIQ